MDLQLELGDRGEVLGARRTKAKELPSRLVFPQLSFYHMCWCQNYFQGNYRIQAVKAQCEIRGLEKQLLLAHMRAKLETEESFQLM